MERVTSIEEMRQVLLAARREGKRVGFVPTMGALHKGHLALVNAACERTDFVVVSIFVNPTQFAEGEDFERYPRDIPGDMELLSAEGVDVVFTPSADEMYRGGTDVTVDPGPIGGVWEGEVRPGHFIGVATVVTKLFDIVQPDLAFFGEKDYQQLVVVSRVVAGLDLPVRIVGVPTVREADGLARSSRNRYLDPAQRMAATVLYRALERARSLAESGETDGPRIAHAMREAIDAEPLAELEYVGVVDPRTLEPLTQLAGPARAIVAARLGDTRLIDNAPLTPAAG